MNTLQGKHCSHFSAKSHSGMTFCAVLNPLSFRGELNYNYNVIPEQMYVGGV